MKNLKKVLALVLALSMILSTFTALTLTASAAAEPAFSDIAGTSYEDAVEVLAALDLVAGYEDGTFGGDKVVTRAEMAAFIVRALGLGDSAKGSVSTNFTDVPADHWASGSIEIANKKAIIVGNGDNTFSPDATVTYEAAVKMLVCALGYEVRANQQGGWPTGYTIEGAAIGLTDGISGIGGTDGCNRGVVAALLFNALEINLMEETKYSGSASMVEETNKTILYDYLKVVKYYDAEITATPTQGVSKTAAGTAKISGYYDRYGYEGYSAKALKVEIGETNPDDYFGNAVIVYAKDNGSNKTPTMLCILDDVAAQDALEVNVADFYGTTSVIFPGMSNTEGTNNSKYVKLYYKTEEDTKAQYVNLLDSDSYSEFCQLVVNGVINDSPDWAVLDNFENGVIKLVDAKSFDVSEGKNYVGSDGIYEKVIIETYFDFVVSEVDTEEDIVITQNGIDITLDESKTYSIVDAEGNELKIEDLQENDVLSVYSDLTVKEDVDNSEVIKVVVYNNPLEGSVTEKTSKAIFIDGEKYELAGDLVSLDDFELDDAGTFYLNAAGDIVYADTTAAAKDYAVFYDVYQDSARKMVFNVITSESEDLELVATGAVDVVSYGISGDRYVKLPKVEYDFTAGGISGAATLLSTTDEEGDYAPYIASYSLKNGSSTQIDTIYMAGDVRYVNEAGDTVLADKFATRFGIWAEDVSAYYNKSENTFGSYTVDASTVIFDIPVTVTSSADADKIKVIDRNGLTNNKTYTGVSVYEVDKNNVAKAVIIKSTTDAADIEDPIAIIQGISSAKDADGEDIYKVYMIQSGRVITKTTEDKDVFDTFGTGTTDDGYTAYSLDIAYSFYPGSVIIFNENSAGAIDNLIKIYPTTSLTGVETDDVPYYRSEFFTTWNNSAEKGGYSEGCDCFIIYGQVADKNTTNKSITINTQHKTSETGNLAAPATYTANYGSANVTVVDYAFEEDTERVQTGTASDIKKGSYVLVRKADGATKDIVVYAENFKPELYL